MQTRTTLPAEPEALADGGIVEREVETVRTREHITEAVVDGVPGSVADINERKLGYLESLPERLSDLGFVLRASVLGLLGIRFLLRASGANTASDFGGFIEGLSWIFARPFANLFSSIYVATVSYVKLFVLC